MLMDFMKNRKKEINSYEQDCKGVLGLSVLR